jgi:hypothetical protein
MSAYRDEKNQTDKLSSNIGIANFKPYAAPRRKADYETIRST